MPPARNSVLESNFQRDRKPLVRVDDSILRTSRSLRTPFYAPHGPPFGTRAFVRVGRSVQPTHGLPPRRWFWRRRLSQTTPGTIGAWIGSNLFLSRSERVT